MYPEASLLGISYDNFWEMFPVEVYNIAKARRKRFIEELNFEMSKIWYQESLGGVAVNAPKKYPNKPMVYEDPDISKQDKLKNCKSTSMQFLALSKTCNQT